MGSLGKCNVKGCENEAVRASVALLPGGGAVPVVVCDQHHEEGTRRHEEIYGPSKKKVKKHAN
jgi:hypothetical protein